MALIAGFGFGLLLVGLGCWQLMSPLGVWRSMRKNTARNYQDPAAARELEPSEGWIFRTRARGVFTILMGVAWCLIVGFNSAR